jgi:hypothetical protein
MRSRARNLVNDRFHSVTKSLSLPSLPPLGPGSLLIRAPEGRVIDSCRVNLFYGLLVTRDEL